MWLIGSFYNYIFARKLAGCPELLLGYYVVARKLLRYPRGFSGVAKQLLECPRSTVVRQLLVSSG